MKIIPAIDIIDGKCVRLTKGDYNTQKTYHQNPLEVAKAYADNGIEYLHLVDLDGAKSQHIVHYKVLERIATKTNLKIDFGGGIKSNKDIEIAFNSGANQITGGSVAAKNKDLFLEWIQKYGSQKIILGADCKQSKILTNGWLSTSEIDVIDFISAYKHKGIEQVICTDIAKDGMLQGPSIALYQEIISSTKIKLIASGGISTMQDLTQLKNLGCEGAIIGKAIYEGQITLKELSQLC